MSHINNDLLRQITFIIILLLLGILLFYELYGFFTGFLGATTLYILLRPMNHYLVDRKKWKKSMAAAALMILSFLIFLVPAGLLVNLLYVKISYALAHTHELTALINQLALKIEHHFHIKIFTPENLQKIQATLAGILQGLLGATVNTITVVAIMYFILYFMLTGSRQMEDWLYDYIPLKEENVKRLAIEVKNMVLSNAIGIPLLALIQALFLLPALLLSQAPQPVFWTVIAGFLAMLPVIGATAIWLPMSIYLFSQGLHWQGLGLLAYGFLVVMNIDNIFRLVLQKKFADVHPLVTMFGVIIGVQLFGFIGLVFGPLLISLFLLLLNMYNDEFLGKKKEVKVIRK